MSIEITYVPKNFLIYVEGYCINRLILPSGSSFERIYKLNIAQDGIIADGIYLSLQELRRLKVALNEIMKDDCFDDFNR